MTDRQLARGETTAGQRKHRVLRVLWWFTSPVALCVVVLWCVVWLIVSIVQSPVAWFGVEATAVVTRAEDHTDWGIEPDNYRRVRYEYEAGGQTYSGDARARYGGPPGVADQVPILHHRKDVSRSMPVGWDENSQLIRYMFWMGMFLLVWKPIVRAINKTGLISINWRNEEGRIEKI